LGFFGFSSILFVSALLETQSIATCIELDLPKMSWS
jgi:hypothetical protein